MPSNIKRSMSTKDLKEIKASEKMTNSSVKMNRRSVRRISLNFRKHFRHS
jgi:hypothetical protein